MATSGHPHARVLENVSYVSDLLQLPKQEDDSAIFCNMGEQLSAEGEARSTTSLPPLHSVAHWLKETNKIRGYEDTNVLKHHRDSLQAHHRGMVGSEVFFSTHHRTALAIMLSSLLLKCSRLTMTCCPQKRPQSLLRLLSSKPLSPWSEAP